MSAVIETIAVVALVAVAGPAVMGALAGEAAAGAAIAGAAEGAAALGAAEGLAAAGVVESAGAVALGDLAVAEVVTTEIASNAVLTAAAEAGAETLATMASTLDATTALTVADTAVAVEQGAAVLEATGTAAATAGADTAAANTIIQAGGTIEQASTAATLVSDGASVAESVAAATEGSVQTNALTEAINAGKETLSSTFDSLSNAAKTFQQGIGETLLPGADATVQKAVGQVAVNTATNGGDLTKGIENTLLSLGTGVVGGEVADVTGSKLAGNVASNVAGQLATTGDVNLTNLGASTVGKLVGSEVADETGSNIAGKAASALTSDLIKGKDPTNTLINLGVGTLVDKTTSGLGDLLQSSGATDSIDGNTAQTPDSSTANPDTAGDTHLMQDATGNLSAVETHTDASQGDTTQQTVGGLNQVAAATNTTPVDAGEVAASGALTQTETSTTGATQPEVVTAPPVGGLSAVSQEAAAEAETIRKPVTAEESVAPAASPMTQPTAKTTTGLAAVTTPLIKNLITSKVAPPPATKRPAGGLGTASRVVTAQNLATTKPNRPAARVDVSSLQPIKTGQFKPVTAPARMDVSKLTPIGNVSSLSSILAGRKKTG